MALATYVAVKFTHKWTQHFRSRLRHPIRRANENVRQRQLVIQFHRERPLLE